MRTMLNGLLLINKEAGITSFDVIRKLKKILPKDQKIGHAGTLDPFATGLLIIMLGKATKEFDKIQTLRKKYIATAEFGYQTETLDNTGKVIKKCPIDANFNTNKIKSVLKSFTGQIIQTTPAYSAVKIHGTPAYKFARQNKKVKMPKRQVTIYNIEIEHISQNKITLIIECSSGTYIRTLISDIAIKMGNLATTIELYRQSIGEFSCETALKSSEIETKSLGDINNLIISQDKIPY
ncbi:tRNA pseudouridine(55) synthase TruB [Candidatus Dojkabacteria bacterium]|nr:tRNA pseudouridine(55) synthase TruB [Candidatus Dojkabacteria bacterium]